MDINATQAGQIIALLAVFFAVIGFNLGKRKTDTPFLTAVLAFFSALVPPIGLVFLMVLALKQDRPSEM